MSDLPMNPYMARMEYAVKGPLSIRSTELQLALDKGEKLPFDEIVRANISDCQGCGQKPMTFLRQVGACVIYPELLQSPEMPQDVKDRVQRILKQCKGNSLGSYTDVSGIRCIREDVAKFISERDGYPSDFNNIFLCAGASDGAKNVLEMLNYRESPDKPVGVMICIPEYPLYSGTLAEFDMHMIGYYLDEDNHWALDVKEMDRAIEEAKKVCTPRGLVIINPGNPASKVMEKEELRNLIKFAKRESLTVIADEVCQFDVYAPGKEFHSVKKVMMELGPDYQVPLASLNSSSKGYGSECSVRGGYCEAVNFHPVVYKNLIKCMSIKLCPPGPGQVMLDCIVNPPQPGEPSYELHQSERAERWESMRLRADMYPRLFNQHEGISCDTVEGGCNCFVKVDLSPRAIEEAKRLGLKPDEYYCIELLNNTGLCVVPGSGFGQRPGTYHFRCTILPQVEQFKRAMEKFTVFHKEFMLKWK